MLHWCVIDFNNLFYQSCWKFVVDIRNDAWVHQGDRSTPTVGFLPFSHSFLLWLFIRPQWAMYPFFIQSFLPTKIWNCFANLLSFSPHQRNSAQTECPKWMMNLLDLSLSRSRSHESLMDSTGLLDLKQAYWSDMQRLFFIYFNSSRCRPDTHNILSGSALLSAHTWYLPRMTATWEKPRHKRSLLKGTTAVVMTLGLVLHLTFTQPGQELETANLASTSQLLWAFMPKLP